MLKWTRSFYGICSALSQEGNFKAGRFALISADEVIVAHTNERIPALYRNKKNEALHSRIIVMPIPYNLRISDEVRIYEKLVRQSELRDVHIAPHALHAAAMVSILSRLKESSKQGMDLVKKMKLYDGEDVDGFKPKDVEELQQGISRRRHDRHRSSICHQPYFQRPRHPRQKTASGPGRAASAAQRLAPTSAPSLTKTANT